MNCGCVCGTTGVEQESLLDDADASNLPDLVSGSHNDHQGEDTELAPPSIASYRRRWYVLGVFSAFCFMQGLASTMWAAIESGAQAAYGWTEADLALLNNWSSIVSTLALIPCAWVVHKKGFRGLCVLSTVLLSIGAGIRCLGNSPPSVIWWQQGGQFLIAAAGPAALCVPSALSSAWFPAHQRVSATATSVIANGVGSAAPFFVGLLIVKECGPNSTYAHIHSLTSYRKEHFVSTGNNNTNCIEDNRNSISLYLFIQMGLCLVVCLSLVVYFPSQPPLPPSLSAAAARTEFWTALSRSCRNMNFMILAAVYGISQGIYNGYLAILDMDLKDSLHNNTDQAMAAWMVFFILISSVLFAVIISRTADFMPSVIKPGLVIGFVLSVVCFLFYSLQLDGKLQAPLWLLYVLIVFGSLIPLSGSPVLVELACDAAYPTPETLNNAILNLINNLFTAIYLLVPFIPHIGMGWSHWSVFTACILCIPLLIPYKHTYTRREMDTTDGYTDSSCN